MRLFTLLFCIISFQAFPNNNPTKYCSLDAIEDIVKTVEKKNEFVCDQLKYYSDSEKLKNCWDSKGHKSREELLHKIYVGYSLEIGSSAFYALPNDIENGRCDILINIINQEVSNKTNKIKKESSNDELQKLKIKIKSNKLYIYSNEYLIHEHKIDNESFYLDI